jgi:hypothetical protein
MSAILTSAGVTFGDGSTQTTTTPTVISAFTNNVGYVNTASAAANYATKDNTVGSFNAYIWKGRVVYGRDVNNNNITGGYYNCNCNC